MNGPAAGWKGSTQVLKAAPRDPHGHNVSTRMVMTRDRSALSTVTPNVTLAVAPRPGQSPTSGAPAAHPGNRCRRSSLASLIVSLQHGAATASGESGEPLRRRAESPDVPAAGETAGLARRPFHQRRKSAKIAE